MMKKRLISVMLICAMLMSACGSGGSKKSDSAETTAAAAAESQSSEAPKVSETPKTSEAAETEEPAVINFMWWGSQTRHDLTIEMIELFMEKNPDITVEYEYGGFETYWDKIKAMMAAGEGPDVFQNSTAYILSHVENDQLLDLDPYIEDGSIDLSDWGEASKVCGVINGKTYGLTMGNSAFCLLYDPVLFEENGIEEPSMDWTWDDYHETLKQIKDKTGLYGDTCYPASMLEGFVMYLRQNGYPGLYTEDRKSLVIDDTELWTEFFKTQLEVIEDGYVQPYDQAYDSIINIEMSGLATGTAGMLGMINSNQAVAIATAKGSDVKVANYPHSPDEVQPGNWVGPTMFLSSSKTTKHPEAVARFIDFMLNDVDAAKISAMERGVPANDKVRQEVAPLLSPTAQSSSAYVGEVAQFAVPWDPVSPEAAGEIIDLYRKALDDMTSGRVSIEEAGEEFIAKATDALQR